MVEAGGSCKCHLQRPLWSVQRRSFAAKWLAPRLEGFHSRHPDIEAWVSADSGLTDFTVADADFAIRYGAAIMTV